MKTEYLVVGGGISGLSIAWKLNKKSQNVILLERSKELGGVMKSESVNGFHIETGPNTVMLRNYSLLELIWELKLHNELVAPNVLAKKRFIYKDEKLLPLPSSLSTLLGSKLISFRNLLRALRGALSRKKVIQDLSVCDFFQQRFGEQVYENFIFPMVSGIYAGDPKKLSFKYNFPKIFDYVTNSSILNGLISEKSLNYAKIKSLSPEQIPLYGKIFTLKNGLQSIANRIGEKMGSSVHYQSKVLSIQQEGSAWKVIVEQNGQNQEYIADNVIFTIPAYALSQILAPLSKEISESLSMIFYAPIQVMQIAIKKEEVYQLERGFGFLKSATQVSPILGCIFSSFLFPHVAKKDYEMFTLMSGGATNPEITELPETEAQTILLNEIQKILKLKERPEVIHFQRYERAIPQYELSNHHKITQSIRRFEINHRGIYLRGNYYDGVSVPDCVEKGMKFV